MDEETVLDFDKAVYNFCIEKKLSQEAVIALLMNLLCASIAGYPPNDRKEIFRGIKKDLEITFKFHEENFDKIRKEKDEQGNPHPS